MARSSRVKELPRWSDLLFIMNKTVSVLWHEEEYRRKFLELRPRDFLRDQTIFHHTFRLESQYRPITIPALSFLGEQYLKSWFSVSLWQLGLYFPVYSQLYWKCTGKYTAGSAGSIFSSPLPVELDLYGKILPSGLSNTGLTEELNFNRIIFSTCTFLCHLHPEYSIAFPR